MGKRQQRTAQSSRDSNPIAIIGSILAFGVIRSIRRETTAFKTSPIQAESPLDMQITQFDVDQRNQIPKDRNRSPSR
jgi:hypothetical protein